jgi:hypothetical protein
MLNREETINKINQLGIFEKREVWVNEAPIEGEAIKKIRQIQSAVCGVGKTEAYCFCHKNYRVIQFHEVFLPIVNSMDCDFEGYVINYGGMCILKVFPEIEGLTEDNNKFGLIAMNSVDKSSAVVIKFCVKMDDLHFTFPRKVAGIYCYHTENATYTMNNFIELLSGVKTAWKHICTEFPKYEVVMEEPREAKQYILLPDLMKKLNLGKRVSKELLDDFQSNVDAGHTYSLWDIFVRMVRHVSEKEYKTDLNREKHIDRMCNLIFEYSFALSI